MLATTKRLIELEELLGSDLEFNYYFPADGATFSRNFQMLRTYLRDTKIQTRGSLRRHITHVLISTGPTITKSYLKLVL